jgi:hypothetical protein
MNFYNEDEKKDGAPAAPGVSSFKKTSAFGKSPLFSKAGGGIMSRLKNLSRKDMAFVGIGLSVLTMAPVAEYMMSKPSADNLLTPGFGSREGSAVAGVYEPGINALSQGSPDGSGEVITPLSSRDPSSLILGSQPAAPVMPPPTAPVTTFRDAMKDVGRNAFSEATKSAGAPTPVPKMQSALRNFGSFFSGGEGTRTAGSLSGGKIIDDAKSASGKAAKRSMMGPVAMPGYKGVASNTPNSSSRGAFEKLRNAADKSAGNFSGGSAIGSLDQAAKDALDIKGGGGMGYGGESDKTTKPSGSTTKYDHNRSGESLAEMAAKQRMQKELDWEFYKKYEIPKQLINAVVGAIGGVLGDVVKSNMQHMFGMDASAPPSYCWSPKSKPSSTDPKDCLSGVMKTPLLKDKDGKVFFHPSFSCICGIGPKADITGDAPVPPAATGGGADQTPKPGADGGTAQVVAVVPTNIAKSIEEYDGNLKMVAQNIVKGSTKDATPKDLLTTSKAISEGAAKCATLAKGLYGYIQTQTPSALAADRAAYNTAISASRVKVAGAKLKLNTFTRKVDGLIAKVKAGGLVKDGIEVQKLGDKDILTVLEAVRADAANYETTTIKVAEDKLAFHDKAVAFYDAQAQLVGKTSGTGAGETASIAEAKAKVDEQLAAIEKQLAEGKDAALPAKDVAALKAAFKSLAAADAANVQVPEGTAAAESIKTPVIGSLIAWRGADKDTLMNKLTVDDKAVKDAETGAWAKLSPLEKLKAGKVTEALEQSSAIAPDFVTQSVRGLAALPVDLKGAKTYTDQITQGMELLDSAVVEWENQIKPATDAMGEGANTGGDVAQQPLPVSTPGASQNVITDQGTANRNAAIGLYDKDNAAFTSADSSFKALPATLPRNDAKYQTLRAQAGADLGKMSSAVARMKDAKGRLEAAKSDAEISKASADMMTAHNDFDAARTAFAASYAAAKDFAKANSTVTPKVPARVKAIRTEAGQVIGEIRANKMKATNAYGNLNMVQRHLADGPMSTIKGESDSAEAAYKTISGTLTVATAESNLVKLNAYAKAVRGALANIPKAK